MFSEEAAELITQLFKTLSNEKARVIMGHLSDADSPLSVSDISNMSGVDYSSTVKACKSLLGLDLIHSKRDGKYTYYSFNDQSPIAAISELVNAHFKTINAWK